MKKGIKIILGVLYWIVSLTWGGLMTIVGLLIALWCLLFVKGATLHKNGFSFIIEFGGDWGGLSLGPVSFCGGYSGNAKYDSPHISPNFFKHIRRHEFGHSIQNLIFGPFMLFVVGIPSLIRSWLYEKEKINTNYDDIWFEYTASKWGHFWVNKIEGANFPYTYVRPKK